MIDILYVADKGCTPQQMEKGDIGFDLRAAKSVRLNMGEAQTVPLGVRFEIPEGYYGELTHRSSLAFQKSMICSLGIIDSSFTDEVMARIFNLSGGYQFIVQGERICQIIFKKRVDTFLVPCLELRDGKAGFGSSGRM